MPATAASIRSALGDPASFATTMIAALLADWGTDFLRWSPATIAKEVTTEFGVDMPPNRFDRLMAGVVALTSNRPFRLVPDFCTLCSAINGNGYDPAAWDPPSGIEIAWCISEATFLVHMVLGRDEDESEPFSPGVRHFIGETCREEGLVSPPDVLRIALSDQSGRDARIIASWSGEPETYAAIHEAAAARSAAITGELKGKLRLLCGQLEQLFGQKLPFAAAFAAAR